MLKILKHCPICNKSFKNSNRKYCSDECSAESIREKDKIRKRKKREAEQQVRLEKAVKRREEREANSNVLEVREHRHAKLKAKAAEGDYMAIMLLNNPLDEAYWDAFKEHELQRKSEFIRFVNGISVYDELFTEKVLFTIKEHGFINSDLVKVNDNDYQ